MGVEPGQENSWQLWEDLSPRRPSAVECGVDRSDVFYKIYDCCIKTPDGGKFREALLGGTKDIAIPFEFFRLRGKCFLQ